MSEHLDRRELSDIPRLPFKGFLDVTYHCNNNCRHCWLKMPSGSQKKQKELSLDEIKEIVDAARKMGCRSWHISGGEPLLRPDFPEIFDYITSKSTSYTLNTNGALITPEIAKLLRKIGSKMVAIYGATADVHDYITRNPGSFEATMRGIAYLREAGTGFTTQIIPMKDNYHQLDDMLRLAKSLGPQHRIGAPWLYLSACGDPEKNREIICQRIAPADVVQLDKPDLCYEENMPEEAQAYPHLAGDDRLFAPCISGRRDFHIDPYGKMTFCCFVKDPDLRYDLREGSFEECWEVFIPSLADKVRGGKEYLENCGSCESRWDCRWCPVYGYLEHRRFSAKVDYLCDVAKESKMFKEEWLKKHRRYYQVAGITIQVDSDLPITDTTFKSKFKLFQIDEPGEDVVTIRHHFSLPNLDGQDLGKEIYRRAPWAVYKKGNSWVYLGISAVPGDERIHKVAVFNHDYTRSEIYSPDDRHYLKGNAGSLALFPTDQIFFAQLLADRQSCYIHSSGVSLDGKGLLFVGHSDAGKSTMVKMLKDVTEILCDDRMIVRRWSDGFRIHGNWSHGEVSVISAGSAPLKAVLFLEQARDNKLMAFDDRKEIRRRLLACLVKTVVTPEWWAKMLDLVENMAREVPFYTIRFDRSGKVLDLLKRL